MIWFAYLQTMENRRLKLVTIFLHMAPHTYGDIAVNVHLLCFVRVRFFDSSY